MWLRVSWLHVLPSLASFQTCSHFYSSFIKSITEHFTGEHSLLKISTRFLGSQELCHRFSISRWWCQGCRQGQSRWRCHCRPCWRRWYSFDTCIRGLSIYVGYKAVSLFEGVAEAYIHTTLIKKWDLCPGHAIIKAYGGNMSKLDGSEINYKYARFSPI